jgi:ribosomal protein S17E
MAVKTVKRFAKNHMTNKTETFTEDNKRGVCEIADILYAEHKQLNRPIAGFSNENYREQYFEGSRLSLSDKVWEAMLIYFTQEQLYRGV